MKCYFSKNAQKSSNFKPKEKAIFKKFGIPFYSNKLFCIVTVGNNDYQP
jgi:hypothetical protein